MKKIISKKSLATKKSFVKKNPLKKTVSKEKKNNWLKILAIGNVIVYIAMIIVNYLAVSLPIGGNTTGELADGYPNLFVPAGITFSIRGVIYLLIGIFIVWQFIDTFKKESHGITKSVGIRFLLSCFTNIGWIFAWHYKQIELSILIMIMFLIILIIIANKIYLGKKWGTRQDKYFVQVPFSVYLGRISVATVANISAGLVYWGWNMRGMSDIFWTIVMIIVVTLLTLRNLYKKYNIIFALVIVRAFIGIIIKRIDVDPIYAKNIIWTLGGCIAVITAAIGRKFEEWKRN